MALNDFFVVSPDGENPKAHPYQTKAGNTAIKAGELVIKGTGGDVEYVTVAADGGSNSDVWVGVAATNDTVTSGADGVVYVYDSTDYLLRGRPTTPGNLATTIINTQVTLDVDGSGNQTIDENDTSSGTFLVRDYDSDKGTIDVFMARDDHINKG